MTTPEPRLRALATALLSLRGPVPGERAPSARGERYRLASAPGVPPLYDVYTPTKPRAGRSVVLVHGGGFLVGARDMKPMRVVASRLVEAGVTVASVDYRMIFRGGRLDEALADVALALEHWRAHAAERALDPEGVDVIGFSAGASLAMLAAGLPGSGVRRLASAFGLYEFDTLGGRLGRLLPRLLLRTGDRDVWAMRSPARAAPPRVPTLLLHGTADAIVPFAQAERLAASREARSFPTTLSVYEGAPHAFFNTESAHRDRGLSELTSFVCD